MTVKGHIGEYRPDPRNARRHNPKNVGLIERSLNEVGAGRSIVTTAEGTVIAGNATLDAAAAAGIHDAVVVRTRGDQLLVHVREDLHDGDQRSTLLAIYDNRATDLSEWDTEVLLDIKDEFDSIPSFDHLFSDDDMRDLMGLPPEEGLGKTKPEEYGEVTYQVVVDCFNEGQQMELMTLLEDNGFTGRAIVK
jgi:hypothetical protein